MQSSVLKLSIKVFYISVLPKFLFAFNCSSLGKMLGKAMKCQIPLLSGHTRYSREGQELVDGKCVIPSIPCIQGCIISLVCWGSLLYNQLKASDTFLCLTWYHHAIHLVSDAIFYYFIDHGMYLGLLLSYTPRLPRFISGESIWWNRNKMTFLALGLSSTLCLSWTASKLVNVPTTQCFSLRRRG